MASLQHSTSAGGVDTLLPATSRDDVAIDALLEALDSRDKTVRDDALAALRKLDAGPTLAHRLADKQQPERARHRAAVGLRLLKREATVPALVAALRDSAVLVRTEAARALSTFGAAAAEDALIAALDDRSDHVRYYSADALGGVESAKVKAALLSRQEVEQHMAVQLALEGALAKLG